MYFDNVIDKIQIYVFVYAYICVDLFLYPEFCF